MTILRRFPFTLAAILLTLALFVTMLVFDFELFHVQLLIKSPDGVNLIDELCVCLIVIVAGFASDKWIVARKAKVAEAQREENAKEIEAQRLRVFKATMRTVQDIVNNFLNNLQLIHLESVEDPKTAELVDRIIQDTATKLRVLGDLESIAEKKLAIGVGIDYGQDSVKC